MLLYQFAGVIRVLMITSLGLCDPDTAEQILDVAPLTTGWRAGCIVNPDNTTEIIY